MRISDWSSDVCSSDLAGRPVITRDSAAIRELLPDSPPYTYLVPAGDPVALAGAVSAHLHNTSAIDDRLANLVATFDKSRSEERRVGKAWVSTCRSRWSP